VLQHPDRLVAPFERLWHKAGLFGHGYNGNGEDYASSTRVAGRETRRAPCRAVESDRARPVVAAERGVDARWVPNSRTAPRGAALAWSTPARRGRFVPARVDLRSGAHTAPTRYLGGDGSIPRAGRGMRCQSRAEWRIVRAPVFFTRKRASRGRFAASRSRQRRLRPPSRALSWSASPRAPAPAPAQWSWMVWSDPMFFRRGRRGTHSLPTRPSGPPLATELGRGCRSNAGGAE